MQESKDRQAPVDVEEVLYLIIGRRYHQDVDRVREGHKEGCFAADGRCCGHCLRVGV